MKYSLALLSAAALAVAKPAFLNSAFDVVEGEPFTLKFNGCQGGCTITLQNGPEDDLKDFKTLTDNAEGGSFTFTPSDIPSDTYAFQITNNASNEENWSSPFDYKGTAATTTSATSATTTSEPTTSSPAPTTTSEETTSESSTTPSTTSAESSTVTTPSSSATTEESSSTSADTRTTTTDSGEPSSTSEIPNPDDGAGSLGAPMTLVLGAAAALFFLN